MLNFNVSYIHRIISHWMIKIIMNYVF